ncbi:urease accessory protein UreD [Corynebacterium crudilactis]|uniref:Urease accessory protein UreD n=1 Tax=Corynebacterium crudilactis TaxID=1652495 RepID=A0A172QQ86_9CORY|nr:urease accessory protein UreD [Corynebacterium crudilactis]ANE02855.1 urease accessory protein UreD [Corynebacterium crudilactis]
MTQIQPVGTLWLTIDDQGPQGRSRAVEQFHQGALRIIRPHYLDDSGQVSYTIIAIGGGYLGGDVYDQRFIIKDNAQALITTQSATKIYRTPQGPAKQYTDIEVGENAVLEYLTDQTIAYRESTYHQFTKVALHPTSTFILSEQITPGWHPEGKHFAYDELRLHTEITDATTGRLFLLDNLLLRPDTREGGFGWTEQYTHTGQMIVMGQGVDKQLVAELNELLANNPAVYGAVNLVDAPGTELRGFIARTLSNRTEDLVNLHEHIASLLRGRWRGQEPVNLRKY